jgi:hypothetical protein
MQSIDITLCSAPHIDVEVTKVAATGPRAIAVSMCRAANCRAALLLRFHGVSTPPGRCRRELRHSIAVVSDREWVAHTLRALAWMVPGELALFGLDELERAKEWAAA